MADNNTGVSSVGLMGLSHFRTSRVSMEKYEPVYLNLFTVEIELPSKLAVSEADRNLFLEGIKTVKGLQTDAIPDVIQQQYKFADRSFAGSGP